MRAMMLCTHKFAQSVSEGLRAPEAGEEMPPPPVVLVLDSRLASAAGMANCRCSWRAGNTNASHTYGLPTHLTVFTVLSAGPSKSSTAEHHGCSDANHLRTCFRSGQVRSSSSTSHGRQREVPCHGGCTRMAHWRPVVYCTPPLLTAFRRVAVVLM